jgi:hypothetical protein
MRRAPPPAAAGAVQAAPAAATIPALGRHPTPLAACSRTMHHLAPCHGSYRAVTASTKASSTNLGRCVVAVHMHGGLGGGAESSTYQELQHNRCRCECNLRRCRLITPQSSSVRLLLFGRCHQHHQGKVLDPGAL